MKSKIIEDNLRSRDIDYFNISYNNCCVDLMVDNPGEVGADRLCNIAGAKLKGQYPVIIIDFGT